MRAVSRIVFIFLATFSFAVSGPFRIQVSPANSTVVTSSTRQLTARGDFLSTAGAGGKDLTSTAIWTSSNTGIATVSAGLVTPVAQGTVTIYADSGPFHGSTTITVIPNLSVSSLTVTPANPSVPNGLTQQFTAMVTYSDSSTQNVTAASTWSSSATAIATINGSGLASTHAQGPTTISASFNGASGTASGSTTLTVIAPLLVSISVQPSNPSVVAGFGQPFTATGSYTDGSTQDLTGSATWSSTNTGIATVDSSGHATTLLQGQTTISAMVGGVTGSTLLTVLPPVLTAIQVTPASTTVAYSVPQQFTATGTFSNGSTRDITLTAAWSSTNAAVVSVNSFGAVTGLQVGGSATITATQNGISGSGNVTAVTFSNANLNGQYAFSFLGSDASGVLVAAASFQADGQGNLVNGIGDFVDPAGVSSSQTFSGTYSIGPDGRGSAAVNGSLGSTTFNFVVTANGDGVITQFDTTAVASGLLKKQDPGSFNTGALSGPFAFSLTGFVEDNMNNVLPLAIVGQFNADGSGNVTSGEDDINDVGTHAVATLSGSYSVAGNGRGLMTLNDSFNNSLHFAFYMVSSSQAFFVSLDNVPDMVGVATQQSGGLGNSALQGSYVMLQNGIFSDDGFNMDFFPFAVGGILRTDGAGNINSNSVLDANIGGTLLDSLAFSGSYSTDSSGRAQTTFTTTINNQTTNLHYVLYQVSPTTAYFLYVDNDGVITGTAELQGPASFSNATLQGNFDLLLDDGLFGTTAISGQLFSDGSGNLSGTEDLNITGGTASNDAFTGTYSVDGTGRGTAAMTDQVRNITSNFRFYLLSNSDIRFVEMDTDTVLVGLSQKQF